MAPTNDDSSWIRQVLVGLGALAVVSLLVGGVVGLVALGAARLTGVGETTRAAPAEPSVYIPTRAPTTTPQAYPDPPGASSQDQGASASPKAQEPKKKEEKKKKRAARPITLKASPAEVAGGERINLTGAYPRGDGATLQVQRFEGSWVDFPVTATVRDGTFATYIYSGHTGKNRFRVTDTGSGKSSNVVAVQIGG